MKNANLNEEWEFIILETHKKFNKKDLFKKEILFALQALLSKAEIKNYFALKKMYCKN
jgi:hypothetical protein